MLLQLLELGKCLPPNLLQHRLKIQYDPFRLKPNHQGMPSESSLQTQTLRNGTIKNWYSNNLALFEEWFLNDLLCQHKNQIPHEFKNIASNEILQGHQNTLSTSCLNKETSRSTNIVFINKFSRHNFVSVFDKRVTTYHHKMHK